MTSPTPYDLWEEILSREPNRIRLAFNMLNSDEKKAVEKHLHRMTTEQDYHEEQIKSAQIALLAINPVL